MKISEKLRLRLIEELDLEPAEDNQFPNTLRTGHWQKSSGAWSWDYNSLKGNIGSQYTMKDCVKAFRLVISEGSIYPENK